MAGVENCLKCDIISSAFENRYKQHIWGHKYNGTHLLYISDDITWRCSLVVPLEMPLQGSVEIGPRRLPIQLQISCFLALPAVSGSTIILVHLLIFVWIPNHLSSVDIRWINRHIFTYNSSNKLSLSGQKDVSLILCFHKCLSVNTWGREGFPSPSHNTSNHWPMSFPGGTPVTGPRSQVLFTLYFKYQMKQVSL